uniref:Alpha-1,2-fucosyltransferase n=1 Tax=viral metagenome TaxID=1070528 RepID=A0A6C0ILL4_9ZZZZ
MLTCYLQGGLGNQLFQIFTTISYSLKYKKAFTFTNQIQLDTKRSTYWYTFLSPLAKFTKYIDYDKTSPIDKFTSIIKHKDFFKLTEQNFSYNALPNIQADNILLCGYFQSYKYFEEHALSIMKLIRLEEQKIQVSKKYIYNNTISIHFRRGDYKSLQDFHTLLTYNYYEHALKYIVERVPASHALIFCEKNDLPEILPMIEKFKNTFTFITFDIIDFRISDWEQLLLMSTCQHNIIANSSYSWWAAYFNTNPGKIVCYPDRWFGPKNKENNTKDMFLASWHKINNL